MQIKCAAHHSFSFLSPHRFNIQTEILSNLDQLGHRLRTSIAMNSHIQQIPINLDIKHGQGKAFSLDIHMLNVSIAINCQVWPVYTFLKKKKKKDRQSACLTPITEKRYKEGVQREKNETCTKTLCLWYYKTLLASIQNERPIWRRQGLHAFPTFFFVLCLNVSCLPQWAL